MITIDLHVVLFLCVYDVIAIVLYVFSLLKRFKRRGFFLMIFHVFIVADIL